MGEIVASMATIHAPQLFTRPPEQGLTQLDTGEAQPDALILFATDPLETFLLQPVPPFAVIASEVANTVFTGPKWTPLVDLGATRWGR